MTPEQKVKEAEEILRKSRERIAEKIRSLPQPRRWPKK